MYLEKQVPSVLLYEVNTVSRFKNLNCCSMLRKDLSDAKLAAFELRNISPILNRMELLDNTIGVTEGPDVALVVVLKINRDLNFFKLRHFLNFCVELLLDR